MAKAKAKVMLTLDTTPEDALQLVLDGEVPKEAYQEWDATRIKALQARASSNGELYCKVSEKGGMSVYGLGRMPVTLYVSQWEKLLPFVPKIEAFLKENDSLLTRKPAKK